ncbi:MAG: tRNA delta(2)-isopentenylpyrophosphate transferase [Bacteroidetes bacterium]|nr:tRNA delta(2)-isopentenylpyrophosphate transferase [Bacteroidota bacterium]
MGIPSGLSLGRDYGTSYRRVIRPQRAMWPETLIIIDSNVRVKLWKGELEGFNVSGFKEAIENPDGNLSVKGAIEETKVQGDLLEVLATVSTDDETEGKERARHIVESIIGLLTLCFGEQILGEIIFEDFFFSKPYGEEGEIHVPIKHLQELSITLPIASTADSSLASLASSNLIDAVSLALRWYSKGVDSTSPIDAFVSYFIGIESVVSGYFASLDPRPVRNEYDQLQKYFAGSNPPIGNKLRDISLDRLADFPLTVKFQTYWRARFGRETLQSGRFSDMSRIRNEIMHGRMQSIQRKLLSETKELLERFLARELGVESAVRTRPVLLILPSSESTGGITTREMFLHPLVAIVGPTAAGKSTLALRLARRFHGEIVNGDSRLVYRHMNIGTAKPSPEERALVPHHLVDIIEPDEPYSLALYLAQARRAIQDIHARGRLPFLVGGTGQYIWGLLEGFRAPQVPPNPSLRARLEAQAADEGHDALWRRLLELDSTAASRIDPRNVRRVVRALEVHHETGIPFSQAQGREPPPYRTLLLGLTVERPRLYQRIDRRVEAMVEAGWPQEVARLLERGYSPDLPSMSSLGYREMAAYVRGELSLEEAVARIKTATHRFARRQHAWFRLKDPRIHWMDGEEEGVADALAREIDGFLGSSP